MATKTTDPTTAHFQEIMRRDIGAHLRAAHGMTDVPKSKMEQDKLHRTLDHGTHDAATEKDTSVLAGVTRKPTEAAATNLPKPRPARKPKTDTVPLPGDKPAAGKPGKPAAATGRKRAAKPAQDQPCPYARAGKHCIGILKHEGKHILRGTTPEVKPVEEKVAANGASPREHNQEVARQLLAAVTAEFAGASKDDQQKVANWLHMLPTGGDGAGWLRYWPTDFPRPTSAGWRKPE